MKPERETRTAWPPIGQSSSVAGVTRPVSSPFTKIAAPAGVEVTSSVPVVAGGGASGAMLSQLQLGTSAAAVNARITANSDLDGTRWGTRCGAFDGARRHAPSGGLDSARLDVRFISVRIMRSRAGALRRRTAPGERAAPR
ncbi:MAG: hypothetical protein L0271_14025, partial [Gemmatimonadetes bacterium]|nr:hypothetical protein [Gemmatimonadota bacterium]